MTILAIDTCETHCSAGLLLDSGQSYVRSENLGRGHAERLLPMIDELLNEAGLVYADITRIAVTRGPGTFTGLRVGLSVARGLALSLGVPCVGLSALVVLAAQVPAASATVHTVIKGRGGQVFYQAFGQRCERDLPTAKGDAQNIDAVEAAALVNADAGPVIGSAASLLGDVSEARDEPVDVLTLAGLARPLEPKEFAPEPFYLRPADAVKAKAILKIMAD